MTNLMQKLQSWADYGRYDWEEETFLESSRDYGKKEWYEYTSYEFKKEDIIKRADILRLDVDNPLRFVPLVLDGTIPVWRPVEFYRPPEDIILCLSSGLGRRTGIVKREEDGYWLPTLESPFAKAVKITHWQPLPALPPPKEGE
jgi:hypothetical protein